MLLVLLLAACGAASSGSPSTPAVVPDAPVDATPAVPPDPPPASPSIPLVIDLHTDTLTQLRQRKLPMDSPAGLEAGTVALREGGFNAVVYAIWPGKKPEGKETAFALLEVAEREIGRLPDVELARSPADLETILAAEHLAVILSLEGAHGLGPEGLATLDALHARGVRMLGPVWSFSNRYVGSSGDGGGGLTDDGRALLARANDLGMVVDVSHASDVATLEICRASRSPVIASHSNTDAVKDHPRNLPDEALRCIGERGGVVGVNLHGPFVGGAVDLATVVRHVEHIAEVAGDGAVALGTDLDGFISPPAALATEARIPALWAELAKRGHGEETLRGWKGENFRRVWREAERQARPGAGG